MSRNNIQKYIKYIYICVYMYIYMNEAHLQKLVLGLFIWKYSQCPILWAAPIFYQWFSSTVYRSAWISFCWYSSYFHYSSGLLFCVCLCLFPSQPCYWMSLVSISFLAFPFHFSRWISISVKWYNHFLTFISIDLLARL